MTRMVTAMDATNEEDVRLADALNEVLEGIMEASRYHGVPLSVLGASTVQAVLGLMRNTSPGPEWRERALRACADAIDSADQKVRQTHEATHVAQ
jgi:hypothetical protein